MLPLSSSIKTSKYASAFHAGFMISFLGSLPPGMVNILMVQLATMGDYIKALWFALGCLSAEIICVKTCLMLTSQALKFQFISKILQWLVLVILMTLTIMSFIAFVRGNGHTSNQLVWSDLSPFIFGFVVMAINPVQIPFWLGWTTILFERKIVTSNIHGNTGYLAGIGLGSLIASALFIGCGQFLFSVLIIKESVLHFIFGCVFTAITLVHARQLIRRQRERDSGSAE